MSPTLFVDLDGTIMRNPFGTAVFPIISARLGAATGLPAPEALRLVTAENDRRMAAARGGAGVALAMDWDDIVRTVAAKLRVPWDLSVEQLVIDHCRSPHIEVLDQANASLEAARLRGWRLVVASHGMTIYQFPVLKALGLHSLFSDFATPDTRLCLKSDRCFWLPYVESSLPAVHVGDLYTDDVVAPISCGVQPVWKTSLPVSMPSEHDPFLRAAQIPLPSGQSQRPTALINHLSELPAVLDRIARA